MLCRRKLPRFPIALVSLLLAGCEPVTAPQGEVRGLVLIEGTSLEGVVVELAGPELRSGTTDGAGRYSFSEVPSGAYVVSVRSVPEDASFPATSRTAVVSGAQSVTVDFLGNYIRTAAIEGSVTSGAQGLPGVTVTLQGAQSGTMLTGLGGSFVFSGLRAGQYQVEISGLPETVTFPSVRTEVELSTGQTGLVTFEGVPELTASVVIRSIARRLPGGESELADPQNLRGELEVTLTVDRGEDTLSAVELLLDGEIVGRQIFGAGVGLAAGFPPPPQQTAPFDIVLPVNTAQFDETSGAVRFTNAQVLLTARLATAEGGPSAWLSSVQVQLRNVNSFTGNVESSGGPVLGDDGYEWIGGELTLSVIPLLYDPSRAVSAVTVDLRRTGAGQLRSKMQTGGAPFNVSLSAEGVSGSDNVVGYQTPSGDTDELRVVSALYADGGNVPGVPAVLVSNLRIDNVGPPVAPFGLPRQGGGEDCCLDNWVGAAFAFHDALEIQPDLGVGAPTATVHVGAAGLSDVELAGFPAVVVGGDLAATADNSSLRAVAVARDALGNTTTFSLTPSSGNSLSNSLGALVGVDLALPSLSFDPASVLDRESNPASGSAWVLGVGDAASGAGPMAARSMVRLLNPAVEGTSAECVFPGTPDCVPTEDGLIRTVPDGSEGYLIFQSYVLDRAGNASNSVTRPVLRDMTAPDITSVQVPGVLIPNGPTTVSAVISDNLDLHTGWVALEFDDSGGATEVLPVVPAEVLGTPFDEDLMIAGSIAQTFPLLVGLERTIPGASVSVPSGTVLPLTAARVVATDVGGNVATRNTPLPGALGFVTRSFSILERGDVGGVADWVLDTNETRVCRSGSAGVCSPSVATSVELAATARGLGGTFGEPFDRTYFYLLRAGEPEWIGVTSVSQMMDGAGPLAREWIWILEWTPSSTVPLGVASLVAVGVDADGNAVRTLDLAAITVEGGP